MDEVALTTDGPTPRFGLPCPSAVDATVVQTGRTARPLSAQAVVAASASTADASVKGTFGPLQNWPLIPLHVLLTSDGRVMSYGTKADGTQTGNFIYDVWNTADGSHLTLANGTGTDLFCSSQLLLPGGDSAIISGGDNWTGTGTTNTGNNNSSVYAVAPRTLTRGANMNRQRWYASSLTLLNGETFIMGAAAARTLRRSARPPASTVS